jgi:hypothetical protein
MKLNITLTWSKIIAVVILLVGVAFAYSLVSKDTEKASEILLTAMFLCAGLLGWRQAATTIKGINTKDTTEK